MKSEISTNNQDSRMESRNSLSSFIMAHYGSQQRLLDDANMDNLPKNRSQIFENAHYNIRDNKHSLWEDSSITSTQNKKKSEYQFYYGSNEIEKYKNRETGRSFGTELQAPFNINQDELYLHLKKNRNSSGTNSNRSNSSQGQN